MQKGYKVLLTSDFQTTTDENDAALIKIVGSDGSVKFYHAQKQNTQKADQRRILPNPMHTATPSQIEYCKDRLADVSVKQLHDAEVKTIPIDDIVSIQPTLDNEKVSQLVEKGKVYIDSLPMGFVFHYDDTYFLMDGNHRAAAYERLGEAEVDVRVIELKDSKEMKAWQIQKALLREPWSDLRPYSDQDIEILSRVSPSDISYFESQLDGEMVRLLNASDAGN